MWAKSLPASTMVGPGEPTVAFAGVIEVRVGAIDLLEELTPGTGPVEIVADVSEKSGNIRTTLRMGFPYCRVCAKRAALMKPASSGKRSPLWRSPSGTYSHGSGSTGTSCT